VDTGAGATLHVPVGANLAGRLGPDGGGHAGTGVLQGAHGAAWALDIGRLGVIGVALVRLDDVLALRGHHNDALTAIHEFRRSFGNGRTTTGSHLRLVLLNEKIFGGFSGQIKISSSHRSVE